MVMRIPKKKRAHKFRPSVPENTGSRVRSQFCSVCSRMAHYRKHQPLWWRILHRDLYR